jgi:hypothetical protein
MKLTLEQICEAAKCTPQDIIEAIISQSKNNQRIIAEAKKEKRLKEEDERLSLSLLETENKRLKGLIDNYNLTNEWQEIVKLINKPEKPQEVKSQIISV